MAQLGTSCLCLIEFAIFAVHFMLQCVYVCESVPVGPCPLVFVSVFICLCVDVCVCVCVQEQMPVECVFVVGSVRLLNICGFDCSCFL